MVGRKAGNVVGPDDGDLDGHRGAIEPNAGKTSDDGNDGKIDGKPVTTIDGITGDEFARDDNGNVLRNKDGSPTRKRGRKPGSGSGSGRKSNGKGNHQTVNEAVETLSKTLLIVHAGLANFMKFEDMALEESECTDLSKSIVNVMDQFDFAPDPRYTAIVGLVSTASMIYAPRYILYKNMKKKEEKKPDNKKPPQNQEQFINGSPFGEINRDKL